MTQSSALDRELPAGNGIESCHFVDVSNRVWQSLLFLKAGRGAHIGATWSQAERSAWDLYAPLATPARHSTVFAQIGQSIDGRIGNPAGETKDISGKSGLEHLHRCRALADVVVVGVGTVLADDPRLTVRLVDGENPVRVMIDPQRRLASDCSFCKKTGQFIIIRKEDHLSQPSISEVALAASDDGSISPVAIIDALVARGLSRIMIEGGPTTIGKFIDAQALDRLHVSISPMIIGAGQAALTSTPTLRLSQALRPKMSVYALKTDLVLDCHFVESRSK